jgi:hypothetical protein
MQQQTLTITNPTVSMTSYSYRAVLRRNEIVTINTDPVNLTPQSGDCRRTDKSVYGDVNPTLPATATGAVGTDVINYTLATTAVTGSNVGTYPIA